MIKRLMAIMLTISLFTFGACNRGSADKSSTASNKPSKNEPTSLVQSDIVPAVNDYSERTYMLAEITQYLKLDGRWATSKTSADAGAQELSQFIEGILK